jgi:hypothetical protein
MDEGNGGLKTGDESSGAVEMERWAGGRVCCVHNVNHSSSALSGQPLISTDHEKNF